MLDDIGFNTDPDSAPLISFEAFGSEFVPDVGHLSDDLVELADGSVLAMLELPGYPFELEAMGERNIRRRQINDLLRGIADSNVVLAVHLVRHRGAPDFGPRQWRSEFARRLDEARRRNCLADLVSCRWFLTVIVQPRFAPGRRYRSAVRWLFGRKETRPVSPSVIRQMDGIMRSLSGYFGRAGARRLGVRSEQSRVYSEIAEARHLILYGEPAAVPLNGPACTLGDLIYTERVICGTIAVQINALAGTRYAKTIAIRDYPGDDDPEEIEEKRAGTYTGQMSPIVGALADDGTAYPFVMAQIFRFQAREESRTRLNVKINRMGNLNDPQDTERDKMGAVRGEVASGQTVRGDHNFALTVFARDRDSLEAAQASASRVIVSAGCVPIAEDMGAFSAYWGMLPGNPSWLEGRSASISSRNFTAFASLEGYPRGDKAGIWGPPIIRFPTTGRTALDFSPHVGDVGHALFLGRTSSGKTLLITMLTASLEPLIGQSGRVIMLDKDRGFQPFVLASGGTYLTLRAGEPSGLAPLRGLPNTSAARDFLLGWITELMVADGNGPLSTEAIGGLRRGIARVMRLPPEQRRMGDVRLFLGFGEGSHGARLDRWCWGGADGWLFDGPTDDISLDAPIVGFDLSALFDHRAAGHVGAYLIHRIRDLIDGRRITVVADEVRFYLLAPEFGEAIVDFALTLRKQNGQLWIAAQEPAHVLNSTVGSDLANQAQTIWAFPARNANPEEYERLGFTPAAYRAMTETMPTLPQRTVLLKRDGRSAVLVVDLPNMADEIAILSGRTETVKHIPDIQDRVGTDAGRFAREFARVARMEVTDA